MSDTGYYWWTFDEGNRMINKLYGYFENQNEIRGFKAYETLIKGEPYDPEKPEECWAVTNRYDPRIIKMEKDSAKHSA